MSRTSCNQNHEMIVVRLNSADDKIPLNDGKHRLNESKLKSLGEVGDIRPGAVGETEGRSQTPAYASSSATLKVAMRQVMSSKLTVRKTLGSREPTLSLSNLHFLRVLWRATGEGGRE